MEETYEKTKNVLIKDFESKRQDIANQRDQIKNEMEAELNIKGLVIEKNNF